MTILLHVRKTCDWDSMTLDRLDKSVVNTAKLAAGIKAWDSSMAMPYFTYRSKIKKIAESQWKFKTVIDPMAVDDDDWVIPTDDDDWIDPNLELPDALFVHWKSRVCCTVREFSVELTGGVGFKPESNCYAIRGKLFRLLKQEEAKKILCEHQKSLKIASGYCNPVFVDKPFSAYNKHPGCAHVLKSCSDVRSLFSEDKPDVFGYGWTWAAFRKFLDVYREASNARQ
jgi:hypothetical protein